MNFSAQSHIPEKNASSEPQPSQNHLLIVFFLTFIFFFIEALGGILSGSLALLADAGHMLQDIIALGLAVLALWLTKKPKNQTHTFGFGRAEVLAAFVNGLSLLIVSIFIVLEAFNRLSVPQEINTGLMFIIATLGLIINVISITLLYKNSGETLNTKGAFLHVLSDALGSIGAIMASILITITKIIIFDLLVSLLITILILRSCIKLLAESIHILMEGKPNQLKISNIETHLLHIEGIKSVHDVHIWSVSSNQLNFSCHLIVSNNIESCDLINNINVLLKENYNIHHSTIQIEHENSIKDCGLCKV